MKTTRLLGLAAAALLAAALLVPAALARPDPGTGATGIDAGRPAAVQPDAPASAQPAQQPGVTAPAGFDWGDAAIGAAIALGAILLALGALRLLRRPPSRHRPLPTH